jgi:hypothetical protein
MSGLSKKLMQAAANQGGSPWDLSAASYDNVSFDVSTQDGNPKAIFFKSDGTKMYIAGDNNDSVFQYTLSTSWDVGTAVYDSISFSVKAQLSFTGGLFFKPDGTKMYVPDVDSDLVFQYSLSTAWDLSTASYDSVSFDVGAQSIDTEGIFFKPDGTKMYISNREDSIYQYTLSSPWDLSTASYDNVALDVSAEDSATRGVFFKPDGTKMYLAGGGDTDSVYQYSLSTAWDLSTASYDNISANVGLQEANIYGVFLKPDGTKMYVLGNFSDTVYQYSL